MKGTQFKKSVDELWKNLNDSIDLIQRSNNDIILKAEEILMETDVSIRTLKKYVQDYKFQDWAEEIYFFKTTKPKFVSIYIFFSQLIRVESAKPYADQNVLKNYYEKERLNLLHFYHDQKEFISYYRRNASYLDKKYFVRFKFDFKLNLSAEFYSYDEDFSTSHDHAVSQIIANDRLDAYLSTKVDSEKVVDKIVFQSSQLAWTAPKVALTELLYALYLTKCFNGGMSDPSEIFRWAETALNINLGNYHKTLNEIKSRKMDQTKFLKLIHQNMELYIDSAED